MERRKFLSCVGLALATVCAGPAAADTYPSQAVKLIVPYAPGGGSDVIMRIVARHIEKYLGQTMPVINVNGAGGSVGWSQAAKARSDGYTVTQLTNAMLVREATKSATVTIDKFVPVANLGFVPLTVTAVGKGDFKDLRDLKAASEKQPGEVSLAMGVGTPAQFVARQVANALGTDLKLVNVGGGAQKIAAVMGGHTHALIEPVSSLVGHHQSGTLRILAVLSDVPVPALPDVPTAKSLGFELTAQLFYGLGAPVGTPPEAVQALAAAAAKLSEDAEYLADMEKINFLPSYLDADGFATLIKKEREAAIALGAELGF